MNNSFEDYGSTNYYDSDIYNYNYNDTGSDWCNKTTVDKFGADITPFLFTLVIMFSCVGNILVLWVLIKYENLRSLTNAFLLNLAISDLVFTFGLPFWASYIVRGWTFGSIGCKAVNFIFFLGYYSSIIFLTVMTTHRYMAVVHPLSMLLSSTGYYSIGISAFIWVLSVFAAVPHLIFNDASDHQGRIYCDYHSSIKWKMFNIYQQNVFFLTSSFTIAFCYIRILRRLLRRTSHTRPKTVKLIFCIVIAFYLGWAPYNVAIFLDSLIYWGISPFNECNVSTMVDYVVYVSRVVAYSHCCLNPVFYVFMGVKFRDDLKKALKSFCKIEDHLPERPHTNLIYSNEMSTH